MFLRMHVEACERRVRCMCMRAQSQASVCSQQKHSFLFFFIFREAALKDKVSGQVSSAGQPDASLSQALSCPHHPTLSSVALSHSCSGNFCPVLSPAALWDQMQFSHHTFPPQKIYFTLDTCLFISPAAFKITCYTIT